MQTVITIEFDDQLRRIKANTPADAIAELREEYEKAGCGSNADLSTLTVHCVTGIYTYPTWDEFAAQFKPVRNHIDTNASYGGMMFETYGDERQFVHAQQPEKVWTVSEDYTGDLTWIIPGFYWINSVGHIVTEYPWKKGQTKFLA
jgi:hypothetical protein